MKPIIFLFLFPILLLSCNPNKEDFLSQALKRYPHLEILDTDEIEESILGGTYLVEENRSIESKKIPLNIYLFPATKPNKSGRVLLEYNGGPAVPNEQLLFLYEKGGPSYYLREFADILIIDQRGTGASKISCKAYHASRLSSQLFDLDAVKKCLEEARKIGDLTQYNTGNAVEDLEEVRKWLKIKQLDLSGLSYGTRVVLEYMRRYPQRVRSMILSGTVPPHFGYVNHLDYEIERQLQSLIERCATDSTCKSHFPNFQMQLYTLRDQLKATPLKVNIPIDGQDNITIEINDTLFVRMVGQFFLSGNKVEDLPLMVDEFFKGNYLPLTQENIHRSNQVMSIYLSQFCPEEISAYEINPATYQDLFTRGEMALMEVRACEEWLPIPTPDWLYEPLVGKAPILLITGANDTQTPIDKAEALTEMLQNTRHIIFPEEGHGFIAYECWDALVSQFLESEDLINLDISCLENIKRPAFKTSLSN